MSKSKPQPANKLLFIVGPTATGKTALGVRLARKFAGEIVSADSRQVYRGMDVGTGKDLEENSKLKTQNPKLKLKTHKLEVGYHEREGVKIWLYDLVDPDYRFSVADYLDAAAAVIEDIRNRGKLPVIVGGTGFYIKALLEGVASVGIEPDWELRRELASYQAIELLRLLEKIDPARSQKLNKSDRANPRRLIRAIEIARCKANGIPPVGCNRFAPPHTGHNIANLQIQSGKTNSLLIGLKTDYPALYQKIDKRVEDRVKAGLIGEIKTLLAQGYSWENSALGSTLGYQEWQTYFKASKLQSFKDPKTFSDIVQTWKFHEHAYARRQMTWFRKMQGIRWFDIARKNWQVSVEGLVNRWYY